VSATLTPGGAGGRPPLLFFVPLDRGSTGGEVFARRVAERLAADFVVTMVETLSLENAIAVRASTLLRRLAFAGSFRRPATALAIAWRFRRHAGPVLQDYESTPATRLLGIVRRWCGRRGPVSLVHHFEPEPGRPEAAVRRARRKRLRTSSAVVAISDHTRAELEAIGFSGSRLRVARPGLTPRPLPLAGERRRPLEGGAVTVLFVGNVQHRKGVDVLVDAVAGCRSRTFHVILAGDTGKEPAYAEEIRARIVTAGLASRVRLTGRLDEAALEASWREADVFVLPSRMEGYGMVVAEAMQRGLPVIASEAGALPELVVPERTGLLVAPDSPEALAAALDRMVGDAGLRERLGAEGRRRAEAMPDWDETARIVKESLGMA
jgi:glycosyltransferase involved in cell wall biosynthesis